MSESMSTILSVDILAYINDCHDTIPEADREIIAEKIARKFDYTSVYDELDDYIFMFTNPN